MSLKRPLLLTVALVVTATSVHSQTANPGITTAARPAALFGDGGPDPVAAAAPDPIRSDAPAYQWSGAGSGRAVGPWVLERPKPAPDEAADGQSGRAGEVDLSALRYFASQNDLARVAAEIRLLRAKNPGWEPPEDLFSEVRSGEIEKPLWDIFAKHDLDGLKAAMEQLHQEKPDWQPSTDLRTKLALAEARDSLVQASDTQQWGAVLDIAASHQMLMTCGDVDALWRTAEALIRTGDETRAIEAYRYVLTSCTKPEDRLATVQKASGLLSSPEALGPLLQLGRRLKNGGGEFDSVRLDLLRRRIGDAAAGKAGPVPTEADIKAVATHARAGDRDDQQLLGWYAYSQKDLVQAEGWFQMALKPGPNAKAAEGLVLSLRDEGKLPEAQAAAARYAGLDPLNAKLMVEVLSAGLDDAKATPLSAEETARLAGAIEAAKSADGAQALGWHLYKANDFRGAQKWFAASADWTPSEAAAIGLLVTAKRLDNPAAYAAVVAKYEASYAKVAELDALMHPRQRVAAARVAWHRAPAARGRGPRPVGDVADRGWDQSADAIVKTYQSGSYDQTLAMLEQRKQHKGSEPGGLSIVRGWAMYNKGDWEGARQVFAEADKKGLSREAKEGTRVIELGYTNPRYR